MTDQPDCITPQGLANLQAELDRLWQVERPVVVRTVHWAASNGDRSENGDYIYGKKRLREIDKRVRFLRKRLEAVRVVDPRFQQNRDRVEFGATVTFLRENGAERTVTLIGKDEIDPGAGKISTDSPIARALLGRRVGEHGLAHMPGGEEELVVRAISYPSDAPTPDSGT